MPCGRTLQDYTHFIKAGVGIQADVTMPEAKIDTLQDNQKYVEVVFDEVKIKEGIVYDKNECGIIRFTDIPTYPHAHLSTFSGKFSDFCTFLGFSSKH